MDVRQIRHFLAVAETLHFGRAADRLGMTQPPLSQSIKALERSLGAPLFERTKRSVALTSFGADWLPHAQKALAGIDALPGMADAILKGEAGRLDLSFVSTADYSILPALVHRFRQLYPDVTLSLTEATTDMQLTALAEGRVQAGIIIRGHETELSGYAYRSLVQEPLVAAVPEQWLAEGRFPDAPLPPEAVIDSPLIVFPRRAAPMFHDLVTGYYTAHGGTAHVAQHAIQMQTIISLVSAGMGIALVPSSLRNLARVGVRYLDLQGDAPQLETGLVWRKSESGQTLHNFVDVARQMTADSSSPHL